MLISDFSIVALYRANCVSVACWLLLLSLGTVVVGQARAQVTDDIQSRWQSSPHADSASESFRHWDKDGEVPAACATCHSMTGFQSYTGEDGSSVGSVEQAVTPDTVIGCATCHHDAVTELSSIQFPSAETVSGAGASTTCIVCHQGRMSVVQVDENLAGLADDLISADLSFLNVHYRVAAASLYGSEVKGGYEYRDKAYSGKFSHPEPFNTCTGCHDPHALTVNAEQCAECHDGVGGDSLALIRLGSPDYDGDGDTTTGVATELFNLHNMLGNGILAYAATVSDKPIVYNGQVYPYFFNDTDADGASSAQESVYPNRYQSWTPRLLRAAYNFQFVAKDPGIYSHNPRYAAQLLIDSFSDLSSKVDLDLLDLERP